MKNVSRCPAGPPGPTCHDANLNKLSQEFRYYELALATRKWNQENLLGQGGFGTVWRGLLRDGTEVAIKELRCPLDGGFVEEVTVLSRVRHPNLVILMGFARNGPDRYLIYELLSGGDVAARLQKDFNFTARARLSVLLDAARGLSHLHCSQPQVFHRDVKTQNILMDKNGTGKVADFGLAVLAKANRLSQVAGGPAVHPNGQLQCVDRGLFHGHSHAGDADGEGAV